jgi:ubiquitin-like 1-activating enzyme E1 A
MEPHLPDFPVLAVEHPVPQYIPQETNGQAVAPPAAEGISAGKFSPPTSSSI